MCAGCPWGEERLVRRVVGGSGQRKGGAGGSEG